MKKRILSILLVAALAAGTLFGCGSVKEETNETTKTIEEGAADAKTASNADSITNTEPVEITIAYPSDEVLENTEVFLNLDDETNKTIDALWTEIISSDNQQTVASDGTSGAAAQSGSSIPWVWIIVGVIVVAGVVFFVVRRKKNKIDY